MLLNRGALLVVGLACLFVVGVSCFADLCGNDVSAQTPSPDGKHKAVVFQRSCGATTGFSTHVSVLRAGSELANEGGNAFITDAVGRVAVTWSSSSTLSIEHAGAHVYLSESSVDDVQIAVRTR